MVTLNSTQYHLELINSDLEKRLTRKINLTRFARHLDTVGMSLTSMISLNQLTMMSLSSIILLSVDNDILIILNLCANLSAFIFLVELKIVFEM